MPELDLDAIRNRAKLAESIALGPNALLRARASARDVPVLLDLVERLEGQLIRETHGHEPGLCEEYGCSSCRYCGKEKPCGCSLAAPEPVEHIKMKCPVCWGETYRKSTDDEGERWEAHYKSNPSCRP